MSKKYNIFKQTEYALNGLTEAFKSEKAFRLEILMVTILIPLIFLLNINYTDKAVLFLVSCLPLVAELLNSAIELTVDLITKDIHPLAKKAKDIASASVFVSLLIMITVWCIILINYLGG